MAGAALREELDRPPTPRVGLRLRHLLLGLRLRLNLWFRLRAGLRLRSSLRGGLRCRRGPRTALARNTVAIPVQTGSVPVLSAIDGRDTGIARGLAVLVIRHRCRRCRGYRGHCEKTCDYSTRNQASNSRVFLVHFQPVSLNGSVTVLEGERAVGLFLLTVNQRPIDPDHTHDTAPIVISDERRHVSGSGCSPVAVVSATITHVHEFVLRFTVAVPIFEFNRPAATPGVLHEITCSNDLGGRSSGSNCAQRDGHQHHNHAYGLCGSPIHRDTPESPQRRLSKLTTPSQHLYNSPIIVARSTEIRRNLPSTDRMIFRDTCADALSFLASSKNRFG